MLEVLREVQLPLLAGVLIAAGVAKLTMREPGSAEGAPALEVLRQHRGLGVGAALAELGLGLALLVTPVQAVRVATVIWFAGATWVVNEMRARRPDAGCGCFGALSTSRIGLRVMVRPLLLAGAGVATFGVPATGLRVLGQGLGGPGLALAAEAMVVLALSPEVAELLARRRARSRPCELRRSPLPETYAALHASRAWREHSWLLAGTEPVEIWRELCWRFLVYRLPDDLEVEVVFAVSLSGRRHPEVRVALVNSTAAGPGPAAPTLADGTASSKSTTF